jgi:uncharacterized membrane protein YfcA
MGHYAHMFSLTILLIAVGLSAGVLAGLFGIGGGLIVVPAVSFVLISQGTPADTAVPTAVATSLGSMVLTSARAVWSHHGRLAFDRTTALRLAPGIVVGAGVGVWLTNHLPVIGVTAVFAVLVTVIGLRMAFAKADSTRQRRAHPMGVLWITPVIGSVSAMVGIGGGSLLVPYLVWNGHCAVQAVALASAMGWLLALMGMLAFVLIDPVHVQLTNVLWVGVAGGLTAPLGVALAHRLSSTRLRRLFGLMLLVVAFGMLWQIHTAP